MKIQHFQKLNLIQSQNTKKDRQNITNPDQGDHSLNLVLRSKFNDHLLTFGARVDKGLERFYDANKDRMPNTLRRYVESVDNKSLLTPMEAQKRAFYMLEKANDVNDIKKYFSDEELFKNLINPLESRAKRGILQSTRENDELLALSGQGVLKNRENLTVYLVKKVFLEAKTVEEINNDLENDLDPDFKADFRFKNPDSPYVYGTTLKALGIQLPEFEYQQSLRYTKAGYSDSVGEKISQGQRMFWDSLNDEDRTARAKKSVEKFEIWWNSHTKNEILDMIAEQTTTLEMLKNFKKHQKSQEKSQKKLSPEQTEQENTRKHAKIGSNKLSQDELFIKWASNNLKLYEANMSEAERDTLHIKRMQRLTSRWSGMTPSERTDYISKMKSGSEPLRYTLIDAWNHSVDLIMELSAHLKAAQVLKPADLLFSTQEFSQFQSKVMTEFWESHPDYASELGRKIVQSQEKIQRALSNGTFEELKKQIMRDKNQRLKEIAKFKYDSCQEQAPSTTPKPQYQIDFTNAYHKHIYGKVKSMPKNFYADMYEKVFEWLPEEAIKIWTKNLNGESLTPIESTYIKSYTSVEGPEIVRFNRALEAALADTLYEFTKDPNVFTMSNSDVKMAMYHLERGEEPIILESHKTGQRFNLNIVKKNKSVDPTRINKLYEYYKQDLDDDELEKIINDYYPSIGKTAIDKTLKKLNIQDAVNVTNTAKETLKDYMKGYGKSLLVLFSEKSGYPAEVKQAYYNKFKANQTQELSESIPECIFDNADQFKIDNKLKYLVFMLAKKYDFVPEMFMKDYSEEFSAKMRTSGDSSTLEDFENQYLAKRKSPADRGKIVLLNKSEFSTTNKLKTLAMEQALADVLFASTGNKDVFGMQFEELCDNFEVFRLVKDKDIPSDNRDYYSYSLEKNISLSINKKLKTAVLNSLYKEYLDEMKIWINNDVKEDGKAYFVDLLGILNPDEADKEKDDAISARIKKYCLNLVELEN